MVKSDEGLEALSTPSNISSFIFASSTCDSPVMLRSLTAPIADTIPSSTGAETAINSLGTSTNSSDAFSALVARVATDTIRSGAGFCASSVSISLARTSEPSALYDVTLIS